MAHPIVTRLQVNLSWKVWLKTLFIHPSVSHSAQKKMALVRAARERQQKNQTVEQFEQRISALLDKLIANDILSASRTELENIKSSTHDTNYKVETAWQLVHKISSQEQKADLRALFSSLEDDKYALYIEIASQLTKVAGYTTELSDRLDHIFAADTDSETQMTDSVSGFVREMGDSELRNLVQRYREGQPIAKRPVEKASRQSPEQTVAPYVNPNHVVQGSFLKTYRFDGFDSTSTELVNAQGNSYSYDREYIEFPTVPFSLALMIFLGFPTRLHDKYANLNFRKIVRNLFGGWDSLNNDESNKWHWFFSWQNYTFKGKRLWNVILLPIKLVIFAVKLATLLLKIALNVLKFFTEFLPEVILNFSGALFGYSSSSLVWLHYSNKSLGEKILKGIGFTLLAIVSGIIHHVARLIVPVWTALTSPEQSARSAWHYGRALNSRWGYIFGFIGAALSVTLTATLWAITLPLVFTQALALFPALSPIVASIVQWPIVASTLSYISGTAHLIAGTVPAAFSFVATLISSVFGATVSVTTLAAITTLSLIVAPVAIITSRILDGLSNLWTKWDVDRPLVIPPKKYRDSVFTEVLGSIIEAVTPSEEAEQTVELSEGVLSDATNAVNSVEQHAKSEKPYFAQTSKAPAEGIRCKESHSYSRLL